MKKTNLIQALFAAAISGLLVSPVAAQQNKGPVGSPSPATAQVPALSTPVAPTPTPAPAPVPEVVVPAPLPNKPEKADPPAVPKYRDPSKPLTIGEMSDIQAAEETEKFFKKHGFTTRRPEASKGAPGGTTGAKAVKPPPPLNTLKVVGMYGVPGKLKADLQLNGVLIPVDRPVSLGKVQVRSIETAGVEIALPKAKASMKCDKKKEPAGCKATETVHRLRVGDQVEWR